MRGPPAAAWHLRFGRLEVCWPVVRNALVIISAVGLLAGSFVGCAEREDAEAQSRTPRANAKPDTEPVNLERATFGGGCFWCVEAVFERLDGVRSVVSGYAGGATEDPTYQEVCSGTTGHAEVVQIEFAPETVSYDRLLEVFWMAHDPTTLNRQGADRGTQYRSVVFYHDEAQRKAAEASKARAGERFSNPIVTEIKPLSRFYPAEDYHQDYFAKNPDAAYCQAVIAPKLKKLGGKLSPKAATGE